MFLLTKEIQFTNKDATIEENLCKEIIALKNKGNQEVDEPVKELETDNLKWKIKEKLN